MTPDSTPPVAPDKATNTSTVPWVFARVAGSVESTRMAVPLINPKFQPSPRRASAIARIRIELVGAIAAGEGSDLSQDTRLKKVRPSIR